jgi:hypothetical protein
LRDDIDSSALATLRDGFAGAGGGVGAADAGRRGGSASTGLAGAEGGTSTSGAGSDNENWFLHCGQERLRPAGTGCGDFSFAEHFGQITRYGMD